MTTICVFGLGEAGSAIAEDLANRGVVVHGFDPADVLTPPGVVRFHDPKRAVAGSDVILAITAARDSTTAVNQAIDDIPTGCIYADLATAAPAVKRNLAATAGSRGVPFADVALMGPVPDRGLSTPALASGPAAPPLCAIVEPLGMPIRVVGDRPGDAAAHKLIRSVAIKGLAAVVAESLRAAEAAGIGADTWDDLARQVTSADEAFLRRLIDGTRLHATRRIDEMEAAKQLLDDLGIDPIMTSATLDSLIRVGR